MFKHDIGEWQRKDFQILLNGSISLYHKEDILEEDIKWFAKHGYVISEINLQEVQTEEEFHSLIKQCLNFPSYYGENLNALGDCIFSLEISNESGLLLVFRNFDLFYKKMPSLAYNVLNILEINSRRLMLTDRRLITFAHSNKLDLDIPPIGACSVMWNNREWLKNGANS